MHLTLTESTQPMVLIARKKHATTVKIKTETQKHSKHHGTIDEISIQGTDKICKTNNDPSKNGRQQTQTSQSLDKDVLVREKTWKCRFTHEVSVDQILSIAQ